MDNNYDVVLIGGGPASATAATLLQRQGHRCLIAERSKFPRYQIGESLIPQAYGTLKRLGLVEKLKQSHFPVKESVRFVSSSGESSQPFYFDESIQGEKAKTWQVERGEFDHLLLQNAKEAGVEVLTETWVDRVLFENERAVGIEIDKGKQRITAKVVVDGSGRNTLIGNQLRLKGPVPKLDKSAIWSYFEGGRRFDGRDAGETTILMIPNGGWFWYIPLPNNMVSVGIVADPNYLFDEQDDFRSVYEREIKKCNMLNDDLLANATRKGVVRGYRRLSYINEKMAGDGWIMVGDAAAFLDPIYSSGLYLAMASAEHAADSIHHALTTHDFSAGVLGAHLPALLQGVEVIRRVIFAFYDPGFSFHKFLQSFPQHRKQLVDCLIGDVVGHDYQSFLDDLSSLSNTA